MEETPGQQAANRRVRKGTKRPEYGAWPMGKMTSQEKALNGMSKRKSRAVEMEKRSKKAGYYVHGHKNLGDVYEA